MSSQKGNAIRTRPQKHQNKFVFKNDLHDTNIRTKRLNQITIGGVCEKCKSVIEWKIKYKKYKMLKAPRCCDRCHEKTIKQPYHTLCRSCALQLSVCPKCRTHMERKAENEDTVSENTNDEHTTKNSTDDKLEENFSDSDYDLSESDVP